jgi:hypothetical protein
MSDAPESPLKSETASSAVRTHALLTAGSSVSSFTERVTTVRGNGHHGGQRPVGMPATTALPLRYNCPDGKRAACGKRPIA